MNKNKALIGSVLVVVILIGCLSYSIWSISKTQKKANSFSTGCFDIDFIEKSDEIELSSTLPLTNAEGLKLKPFTFTLLNKCTIDAKYQINLEVLPTTNLNQDYVVAALNANFDNLTSYNKVDSTITGATAYNLKNGTLKGATSATASDGETATYDLRLWLDESATNNEMNKLFTAKIVVTSVSTDIDN